MVECAQHSLFVARPRHKILRIVSGELTAEGVKRLRLPPRSPNLNSYAERWVRTVKEECLSKLILFGEGSLRLALREFEGHYHGERNHQGKGNSLLFPRREIATTKRGASIRCHERLGGLLKYYLQKGRMTFLAMGPSNLPLQCALNGGEGGVGVGASTNLRDCRVYVMYPARNELLAGVNGATRDAAQQRVVLWCAVLTAFRFQFPQGSVGSSPIIRTK